MATLKITNNAELANFANSIVPNKTVFAIRTKTQIEIFNTKRSFNAAAKKNTTAVQGELNDTNYIWYRF